MTNWKSSSAKEIALNVGEGPSKLLINWESFCDCAWATDFTSNCGHAGVALSMVSHDIFVMPLAVFGSQKKVALKYYEDYHWINYIAGLAIIVDAQNNLRYIPVKGAESGVIDYLALYMAEHKIYTK